MQGSTSPSKNGRLPNSGPQVTLSRTRPTAFRARSLVGSSPKPRRSSRVNRLDRQCGVAMSSPQLPSGRCWPRSWAPHPSEATRDRSAATTSAGSPVRSRITCQRIEGSESSSHCMIRSVIESAARSTPLLVHRAHLGSQHILPSRVHNAIDPELKRGLRCVGHVFGVSEDLGALCRILNKDGFTCDGELVASWLRLRKALKSVPAVPHQILPLRRSGRDEHKEAAIG